MINLGKGCDINLQKLIATRMLITANSGGGKSWAIRKFLEESSGQVQQIILDLEGDFITLREKYDYLLVGKEGEIPISIRTAELLAKKLLELNVSTIIDLSELKHPERITFVKRFLDSLVNANRKLWHPVIIVVDEAHQFCPEKSKSESMAAVIDLMTRGRKRGFCGVLATQRISKLHKDAAAECNNKMSGRTGLDIDMKRAGEELGFNSKEDILKQRDLDAGEFFCFGPAFEHNGVKKFEIGNVKTTHPDKTRGIEGIESSPTPENIKKLLKDIVDLPKEAEEELRTTQEMKNKIKDLKTKITILEKSKPKPEIDRGSLERVRLEGYRECEKNKIQEINEYKKALKLLERKLQEIGKIIGKEVIINYNTQNKEVARDVVPTKGVGVEHAVNHVRKDEVSQPSTKLRPGAMRILGWIAGAYPESLTKQRIATLSGFSVRGGTFNVYVSELRRNGWIEGNNELTATEEGLRNSTPEEIPSGESLLMLWKNKFRPGVGKMLQFLFESYPNKVSKEEVGINTGFSASGGTFNVYMSELKRNGLIEVNSEGVKISDEFFE